MSQYCAIISLVAGIVFAFFALLLEPKGVVDGSACWVVAQLLIYSASIFGVKVAIKDYIKRQR